MKIKSKEVKFSDYFNIGHWCYILDINKFGIEYNEKELLNEIQEYKYIIIKGEPFEQSSEVSKFIKKIIKKDENTKIFIYCTGKQKPVALGTLHNVFYNVVIPLNYEGLNYKNRINDNINYYINMGANFIFKPNKKEDINEIELIVNNNSIPRYLVFVDYCLDVNWLYQFCKKKKYNICINLEDVFNEFI